MAQTFLLTGVSGFLGLTLAETLLAAGHRVVGLSHDDLPESARAAFAALPGRLEFVRCDLAGDVDLAALLAEHRPGFVITAAAITPGPGADGLLTARTIDVNVAATYALLETARAAGVRRFFQPSSMAVYGAGVHGARPLRETDPARSDDLYSISKYAAERIALRCASLTGFDVRVGRIAALFGPWERETGVRDRLSPHLQLLRLAASGREVVVDRRARRDWTPAEDVAAAIVGLLALPDPKYRLYNLGCGTCWPFEHWPMALAAVRPDFAWRFAEPGETGSLVYHDSLETPRQPLDITRLREAGLDRGLPSLADRLTHYAHRMATPAAMG
jgi:nucleoside-diphosphate-sugar epimerase